jgi:type II secretory pathway component PulF
MALIVTPRVLAQRAELYQQLASLLSAGVGMLQALELLHRNPPARSFREPLAQTRSRIQEGHTFAESLARQGAWIPPFDLALIQAGEKSGRLAECCRLLSTYYEERAQLIRRVIGDLAYPLLIIHFAVLIFPTSQLTGLLQNLSPLQFVQGKLALLLPAYAFIGALIYAAQAKRAEPFRAAVERALAIVPLIGSARSHLALARLSAALEALISAGVTIIEAWELAANASGSPAIRRTVQRWRHALESGETPGELLSNSPVFPELFSNLYATGELSGQLDETLRRLHRHYQEEGSRKLHLVARWAPMLVYLIVVLVIAYQVVSFWAGYYQNIGDVLNF